MRRDNILNRCGLLFMEYPVANERIGNIYRRTIMNRLNSYAIVDALILHNSSILTEEMIAFNLAWLRLSERAGAAVSREPIEEALSLDITNKTRGQISVTGADMTLCRPDLPFDVDPDGRIACLGPGQAITLSCTVRRGNGAEHCKFCPARRVGLTKKEDKWGVVIHSFDSTGNGELMVRARQELLALTERLVEKIKEKYPSTHLASEPVASRETPTHQTEPVRSTS